MRTFSSVGHSQNEHFNGHHRFEHWYRDNTVYFITARVRDRFRAFASDEAKEIFWNRFDHYTSLHGYIPWITTLIDNHYHTLGYLKEGKQLGQMMRTLHGSIAKLVNDTLPNRHLPFWRSTAGHDYFDGCIRDEKQCRRAYRYTLWQCRRHGYCTDWHDYPHTHVKIDLDRGVKRALQLNALMTGVPYPRYEK